MDMYAFKEGLGRVILYPFYSKVLIGVSLGEFGSRCNRHYTDDLLVLTTGGLEDLRVVKLNLYVFEGLAGLETNFSKTCMYSSKLGDLPEVSTAETLNCVVGTLSITYLGILISRRRRPHKQDWEGFILKIKRCLSAWKVRYLSLGWRLTLVNSVLSALPLYRMSIF